MNKYALLVPYIHGSWANGTFPLHFRINCPYIYGWINMPFSCSVYSRFLSKRNICSVTLQDKLSVTSIRMNKHALLVPYIHGSWANGTCSGTLQDKWSVHLRMNKYANMPFFCSVYSRILSKRNMFRYTSWQLSVHLRMNKYTLLCSVHSRIPSKRNMFR